MKARIIPGKYWNYILVVSLSDGVDILAGKQQELLEIDI